MSDAPDASLPAGVATVHFVEHVGISRARTNRVAVSRTKITAPNQAALCAGSTALAQIEAPACMLRRGGNRCPRHARNAATPRWPRF